MTDLRLPHERLDWLEVDGEVIALDGRRSEYLATNPAGALLWRALAEGASEHRLAELLVERYGLDGDAARADAARFVAQLRRQGLLDAC